MLQNDEVSVVGKPKQEIDKPTGCIEEGNRQTSDRPLRWKWVSACIWTDNMLTALENGVKGGKWFSLIDKVTKPLTLFEAWEKVKSNKGAAGVDKISVDKFEAKWPQYLDEIRKEIIGDQYCPEAVRRVYIPKGNGKTRPLGIPTIKDRVVQTALKMVLEPIFEQRFHEHSYGFRPERGAKDALRQVAQYLKDGFTHVVDVDFQSFFDTIPHDRLMELVGNQISDGRVLKLIDMFLTQGIMEDMKTWVPTQGTPQGGVISPLLANIYLNDLDYLADELGVIMIRYADDYVILTKSKESAIMAKEAITTWATSVGLTVHPEKTQLVDYGAGEGFDFLGYRFERGYRFIRKKSITKLRDAIREKTRRLDGRSMNAIIGSLNRMMRGWYGYFKHAHYTVLQEVDQMVRRRLRAIYRKREKRPGFGRTLDDHKRWPNSHFAKLGLFTNLEAYLKDKARYNRAAACQSR